MTLRCLNVFGRRAAPAAQQREQQQQLLHSANTNRFKPVQWVAANVAVACASVCAFVWAYLMRLCFASVLVCVPLRTIAVNRSRSLSLSHSLRLALLFAELPVRAAWPAWQVTVSANEREIPIALWTNCDCAIAWHRFINWFLLWFSQLVRCGAVCVRSVNERYSHTTHAFLFRQFFSIIGFLSLLEERERECHCANTRIRWTITSSITMIYARAHAKYATSIWPAGTRRTWWGIWSANTRSPTARLWSRSTDVAPLPTLTPPVRARARARAKSNPVHRIIRKQQQQRQQLQKQQQQQQVPPPRSRPCSNLKRNHTSSLSNR